MRDHAPKPDLTAGANAEAFMKLQHSVAKVWLAEQTPIIGKNQAVTAWASEHGKAEAFSEFVNAHGGPAEFAGQSPETVLADFLAASGETIH